MRDSELGLRIGSFSRRIEEIKRIREGVKTIKPEDQPLETNTFGGFTNEVYRTRDYVFLAPDSRENVGRDRVSSNMLFNRAPQSDFEPSA